MEKTKADTNTETKAVNHNTPINMVRNVPVKLLAELQNNQKFIRNICILAHVDHGKTTLSDSLISSNGIISDKMAGTARFLDYREDEQLRGITMKSSGISLLYKRQNPTDASAEENFLINLIDSPGHVDFSADVSTAVRLCDGALVVVDVVEGVCMQTRAVLRQAWEERLKPCLVLNKIDRLATELKLTPDEAYLQLVRTIEQVNSVISGFISNEVLNLDSQSSTTANQGSGNQSSGLTSTSPGPGGEGSDAMLEYDEENEKKFLFSPERGNVVFASGYDRWAFRLSDFVPYISANVMEGVPKRNVYKSLWGPYAWNGKTKQIIALPNNSSTYAKSTVFVQYILSSIWEIYGCTVLESKPKRLLKIIQALNLSTITEKDLAKKEPKSQAQTIMSTWLPLANAVLGMVAKSVPDPIQAQQLRSQILWPSLQQQPVDHQITKEVRAAVTTCNSSDDAPLVIFVAKMVAVPKLSLPKSVLQFLIENEQDSNDANNDTEFIAYARIFSGNLVPRKPVYVIGPKHDPNTYDEKKSQLHGNCLHVACGVQPLMIMGNDLVALDHVPAGNVLAIAGLGRYVLKTATISTTPYCQSLTRMPSQSAPILRVSIEPSDPRDWQKLAKGLKLLNRADPVVEIRVQPTGEHVLCCIGELHLERCIKDLNDRFAEGVQLKVSPPIAAFQETIVIATKNEDDDDDEEVIPPPPHLKIMGTSAAIPHEAAEEVNHEEENNAEKKEAVTVTRHQINKKKDAPCNEFGQVLVKTQDNKVVIVLRAVPLPISITRVLEEGGKELRKVSGLKGGSYEVNIASENESESVQGSGELDETRLDQQAQEQLKSKKCLIEIRENLIKRNKASGKEESEWDLEEIDRIWQFGPNYTGPNVLVNHTEFSLTPLPGLMIQNAFGIQVSQDNASISKEATEIASGITWGFQLAMKAGPVIEEPLWGVGIIVDAVSFTPHASTSSDSNTTSTSISGSSNLSGQVMSAFREGCKKALKLYIPTSAQNLSASSASSGLPRFYSFKLVEAHFKCLLQCNVSAASSASGAAVGMDGSMGSGDQLGKLYSVISKRRGKIENEDLIPGTTTFTIEALIPVAETFGLADDLRKKTSGAASTPQYIFSHWDVVEQNDVGQRYITEVKKRKGLEVFQRVAAEKQRNLSKNV